MEQRLTAIWYPTSGCVGINGFPLGRSEIHRPALTWATAVKIGHRVARETGYAVELTDALYRWNITFEPR